MTDKQIIKYCSGVGCAICKQPQPCIYMVANELQEQLQAKEQECEKLKKTFDGLFKVQYKLADNNKKLRQTLTEIKEIAETAAKCMYATYSDDYTEGYSWLGRIILQTISECEGNDETN